jgi:hypothetical protein
MENLKDRDRKAKNLRVLHLSEMHFDEIVIDSLIELFNRQFGHTLEKLHFKNISFMANENVDRIVGTLITSKLRLTELKFIDIPLNKTNVQSIAEYLTETKTIRVFHLINNGITEFACLAPALFQNKKLYSVDISHNKLNIMDLNVVLTALSKLKRFKKVRLIHCGFSEEETSDIHKWLSENLRLASADYLMEQEKSSTITENEDKVDVSSECKIMPISFEQDMEQDKTNIEDKWKVSITDKHPIGKKDGNKLMYFLISMSN